MTEEKVKAKGTSGGFHLTPGIVFLAIAVVGSVAFAAYAVTVRDASQIPLLAAGAAVCGIAFIALAAYALRATWRAGVDGRTGRAFGVAIGGGIAAIIGFGFVAGAIILFLLSRPPT
jgi:hypothetical protein